MRKFNNYCIRNNIKLQILLKCLNVLTKQSILIIRHENVFKTIISYIDSYINWEINILLGIFVLFISNLFTSEFYCRKHENIVSN